MSETNPPFEAHVTIDDAWLDRRIEWAKKYHCRNTEKGDLAEIVLCMAERIKYDSLKIEALLRVVEAARSVCRECWQSDSAFLALDEALKALAAPREKKTLTSRDLGYSTPSEDAIEDENKLPAPGERKDAD